jgi:hypothetical protein
MPIRFRKRPRLGPIQFNITEHGLTSWSLRIGPFTWNSRTRRKSVDLPGPWRWPERVRG